MSYDGPGIYRHYKGGYYRAWGVAVHESTGAKLVVYSSLSAEHELERMGFGVDFVARPLSAADGPDAFNEPHDGGVVPTERFLKEDRDA